MSANEVAHAMPVLQWAHPGLKREPAPNLALMRRLARRCGISDGALRTALSRACAVGALEADEGRYRLGPLAQEEAASARALRRRLPGYVLVVVSEGVGAGQLSQIREVFQRFGFRPLQRSVWIGARTADDRLGPALASAGLGRLVLIFPSDEVDAATRKRLAEAWNLPARAARLGDFHMRLFAYLTEPGLGPREAAWRCVETAPAWYRTVVRDEPPFPLGLCGPDYPLAALNADWSRHLERMSPALADLWAERQP
jgi:DNA-binding transcriptional regulator PaaX